MGTQRLYNPDGGFSSYLYHQVGDVIVASNGVEGKIIEKIDGTAYDGLPTFSNTSEVYLKKDNDGNIIQARIYKNRKPICDFDWDHLHTNADGEKFLPGTVHVQEWKQKHNGDLYRDYRHARYMSNDEILRFGELLKTIKSDIKLTP